jgi:8-oxo-dGTP diphosphatase
MRKLCEVNRFGPLPANTESSHRTAVRAIIRQDDLLLMVHSPVNGDYKFPGGGVEAGESHTEALVREVLEETGCTAKQACQLFGYAKERRPSNLPGNPALEMDSFYYFLDLASIPTAVLHLDDYEARLGFHPVWVHPTHALLANRQVLASDRVPLWTERDTAILQILLDEWFNLPPAGNDQP